MIKIPDSPNADPGTRTTRGEATELSVAAADAAASARSGRTRRVVAAGLVAAGLVAAVITAVSGAVMMQAGPLYPESEGPWKTSARPVEATPPPPADATPPGAMPLVVAVDFVVPPYQGGAERFRTPATIDTALADDLGKRLRRPVIIVGPEAALGGEDQGDQGNEGNERNQGDEGSQRDDWDEAAAVPATRGANVRIALLDGRPLSQAVDVVPLDYRAAPMAIMRTDSPIDNWKQLTGRTVCVAAGGPYVGDLQRQYGAIEIVHPSPTDALVAVRVGECDAMVHDGAMLERLIRLPEWAKFSKTLPPPQPATTLALLAPRGQPALTRRLRAIAADWKAAAFADGLVANAVRNIAFEVYLQQEVPDCH